MADYDATPEAQDWDQFKVSTYPAMDPDEARRHIRTLLIDYNITINPQPIVKDTIEEVNDEVVRTQVQASIGGVVYVMANVDTGDTENTAEIRNGYPVVFDMSSGRAVTGIKDTWDTLEYHVVGIALRDYDGPGMDVIPVALIPLNELPHKAKYVTFALDSTLTTSDEYISCTIVNFWDGNDPDPGDSGLDIYNAEAAGLDLYIFHGSSGLQGIAVFDPENGIYRMIQLECP